MKSFEFDVFGRQVLIVESKKGWTAFYTGAEGKRRLAREIVIPPEISEIELLQYLDDLCHEWATERYPNVRRLDQLVDASRY